MDTTALDAEPSIQDARKISLFPAELQTVLCPIMNGIVQTFGRNCEVVLHDFSDPEHSIVAIEGDVTHRHIGGSVTQIGMSLLADGDDANDRLNYITRSPDGRVIKSSTIPLRDPSGHVFGAFCINLDVTDLRLAIGMLDEIAGSVHTTPAPVTFVDDIGDVIRAVVDEEEARIGYPIARMTKQDRLAIFRSLEHRGVFALQRSVPQVAEYIGISRSTAYGYLDEIRATDEPTSTR